MCECFERAWALCHESEACVAHHGMLRLSLAMFASPPRSRSNRVGRPVLGCSGVEITCSDGDDPGGESDELPRRVGSELSIGRSVCCADPESCARRSRRTDRLRLRASCPPGPDTVAIAPWCQLLVCRKQRWGWMVWGSTMRRRPHWERRERSGTYVEGTARVALPWVT